MLQAINFMKLQRNPSQIIKKEKKKKKDLEITEKILAFQFQGMNLTGPFPLFFTVFEAMMHCI